MSKVISQIWNYISFLEKGRIDGSRVAVCSHGCFIAAAFFFFTHIFQATQEELDRIWETELLVKSLTCLLHLFLCCSGFCTEVHQA